MADDQLGMFDEEQYGGAPGFVRDSETSHDAAMSMLPSAGTLRRRVYDFLHESGSVVEAHAMGEVLILGGAIDEEIEEALDLKHQTASARRRELVLAGLVRDSGQRRRTSSGRRAVVWEVA